MSRSLTGRLAAPSFLRRARAAGPKFVFPISRSLSQTTARWEDSSKPQNPPRRKEAPRSPSLLETLYGSSSQAQDAQPKQSSAMADLSQSLVFQALNKSNVDTSALSGSGEPAKATQAREDETEPFHFHIMSHKHNTHVTCTRPNREAIISMSCGNIGFKKSRRGTFDAAYSLTKYVLERLVHTGWPAKIKRLEVVTRGFGKGRDAAIKVLMSPEGRLLREKIVRVADATRIKYAGTRSKKPRRL